MKQTDIAWAAGFIVGEGHIALHSHSFQLIIGQKDRNPLDRFVEIFKMGKVKEIQVHYQYKNIDDYRQYYRLAYSGDIALFIVRLLLPFLTVKKTQAQEAIRRRQAILHQRPVRRLNNKAQAICKLHQHGYTFSTIGKMLGISRQRAHQLYQLVPEEMRQNNSPLNFFQA